MHNSKIRKTTNKVKNYDNIKNNDRIVGRKLIVLINNESKIMNHVRTTVLIFKPILILAHIVMIMMLATE
jgi:hypothetical protein